MLRVVTETMAALFGVVGFAVLFGVPRDRIIPAGIAGGFSWTVYRLLLELGINRFGAIFASAATLSGLAEWGARRLRVPVSVFVVPGIIPLVPGADAYFSMLAFLHGKDQEGLRIAVQTMLSALSIAAGVVAAATVWRVRLPNGEIMQTKK